MNPVATIRERAEALLQSEATDDVGKAAALLNAASDIEQKQANILKLEADLKKLKQDLGNSHQQWQGLLTAVTPLITTGILAGTLIFQIHQADQQAQETQVAEAAKIREAIRQAQAVEQARFTETVKIIQSTENISPSEILLNTFTSEPQKSAARQMALKLMLAAKSEGRFEAIFSGNIEPPTLSDLPSLVGLDKSLASRYDEVAPNVLSPVTPTFNTSKLSSKKKEDFILASYEIVFISNKIALLLQTALSKEPAIDLSNVSLAQADLRGVNLHNANLTNVALTSVNLDDCDLGGVTSFQYANFWYTAWWHASRISKPFLIYLETKYPYHAGSPYPPESTQVTQDDYARNLARLKASDSE